MTWLDCDAADFFTQPVPTSEVQDELPPGFVATDLPGAWGMSGPDPPLTPLLFTARQCGNSTIGANVTGAFVFFSWAFFVRPPARFQNESIASNASVWHITPHPAIADVFAAWGIGGLGNVSIEKAQLVGGVEQQRAVAMYDNVSYEFTSACPPVGYPTQQSPDQEGDVSRAFGVRNRLLGGVVTFTALNTQGGTAGEGDYAMLGAEGVHGAHPNGRAAVSCGLEPFTSQEIRLAVPPERNR